MASVTRGADDMGGTFGVDYGVDYGGARGRWIGLVGG
jgi:hypothetical protein